jgi:putative ABC transport system permease protein
MSFKAKYGYEIGDSILYTDSAGNSARGIIYGFVEYWPGYSPVVAVEDRGGAKVQEDRNLIVANLGVLQDAWGVHPYQVWMKTNTPSNRFFYDFAEANGLRLVTFEDAKAGLVDSKSEPILQGTNGVLTVGFIVTLAVCFTGFLIYWILSIKSRVLQFGVFRAMGMTMGEILGLLVSEQLLITFTSVAIGALVGEVGARLFVPLIQISYSASEQVIPLRVTMEAADYINLFTVIGAMIALCLAVLGVIISRIRMEQALKLGED